MKRDILIFCAAALATLAMASCTSMSSGGGQTIRNPSVDDMARLEQQWGLPPREVKPKMRELQPGESYAPTQSAAPSAAPLPAPAPLPEPAAPSVAPQTSVDPATLQKLR